MLALNFNLRRLLRRGATQMPLEPIRCQMRHLLQGARLLKQMGRARNDSQMLFRFEFAIGFPIEVNDNVIQAADDQQRRGFVDAFPSATQRSGKKLLSIRNCSLWPTKKIARSVASSSTALSTSSADRGFRQP